MRRASTTPASSTSPESRGGGWVVAQFALMAAIAVAWFVGPRWADSVRTPLAVAGVVLAVAGIALVAWSRRALGRAFTAFPHPRTDAGLVTAGPYRLARHPMYGGALLLFGGISLARTPASLGLTVALGVLWWGKSSLEDRRLRAAYGDYDAYRAATPKRFLPYLL